MSTLPFDCPRTCRSFEKRDWCRFNVILQGLGTITITSHTAKVTVNFKDTVALKAAALAMGGQWLGEGTHKLFSTSHTGLGFKLPGWSYPLVVEKGELAYDDYGGRWGKVEDLDRLKAQYATASVEMAATALGWLCERTAEGGLVVHHPDGGSLALTGTGLDLTGFQGQGCHDALMQLGIPLEGLTAKPEYGAVKAEVQLPG